MRKPGWAVVVPVALLLIAMPPLWAGTDERVNVELIIDASGSMGAKMDSRRKIDIAKEVLLTSLVGKIPANAQVAVRAYGHHRKEDCNDLELLTPFGPKEPARIRQKVQALKPVGNTPIAGTLEAAGKDFAGREGQRNMIVLVSDGKETCQGDPCAVARSLHQAGIQVQIDVIGFDVAADEREQLVCIADAGGGRYYDAANAKEFKAIPERIANENKWQVAQAQSAAAPATPAPQSKKIVSVQGVKR
jgi:Ca-activated chloride channel family protein